MLRFLATLATFLPVIALAQVPDYVGSETCIECHEDAAESWAGSHHAKAWMAPGPDTIVADFDGSSFEHDGTRTEFRRQDDGFYAKVTEKDGETTDYRVHSVVGIEPLQQYLFETGNGRLQSFDVTWDTENERWYHLYPDQNLPPNDGLHWTGPYKNWNARCAECHATGYRKNYGPRTRSYASAQVEIGVGCEACHGPGSAHIEWTTGKAPAEGLDPWGFTMSFGKGDTEAEIQQCATCHSRREALDDGNPLPGTVFHDAYNLAVLRPGQYHADGQILDEVYVYGSFLQSKMYANGVGCMNCHEPHGAGLKAEGNAVCTQCHSPAGNPDFPSLTLKDYDSADHTHHDAETDGAQCKSCHMIERVYMGVDGRRDHSFRIPRPDLGAKTGSPDACTDCHTDEGQEWAAARIAAWFPDPKNRQPHYGEAFSLAGTDPVSAAPALIEIAQDTDRPGIVRATALYMALPAATPELAGATEALLADPDPLVRGSAAGLQQAAPAQERVRRLIPLLQDERRSVRITAVKQLLDVPPQALSRSEAAIVGEAMEDWQRSLSTRLDFPETHLVLGGMALTMRNAQAAARAFREVVEMDPQRADAWPMLVRLTHINDGPDAARRVLREALRNVPGDPALRQLAVEMQP